MKPQFLRKQMNFLIQSNTIKIFSAILLFLSSSICSYSQESIGNFEIRGVVYGEVDKNNREKLEFAAVSIPEYMMGTHTDEDGSFVLRNVPLGRVKLSVRYVGKVNLDTTINVNGNISLTLVMKEENFRLTEVVVTAVNSQSGKSTASTISRNAIDHLQATSLSDLMALLPGGITSNQRLNDAKQVNIRNASGDNQMENMNAFGVSIIQDGAPISNNANLQILSPTANPGEDTRSLSGGASPAGGTDLRLLSTDHIESIEVIRGIPSVQYGDLTSGAIIINSKAGRAPLNVKIKANPNVYEVSAGSGFSLGEKKGSLNINGDYAHNTNNITQSYLTYQRSNIKLLYSNLFFNRLTNNTSVDFTYGADRRKLNPDDKITMTESKGDNVGARLTTNGVLRVNKPWLTNIRYSGSASYTAKKSFLSKQQVSATASYSMTTTDGAILSNKPGVDIPDKDGNKITNIPTGEESLYAVSLPATYIGRYDIDGKEINAFAKLTGNLYKRLGNTNHSIMLGVDFKTDGNIGDGKTFDPRTPPLRTSTDNVSFRPRPYKDIPFVQQLGVFVEEDFSFKFAKRTLSITGGLRYDRISVIKDVFSPRVNASLEIIPNTFFVRGGYGVTAKAPSVMFLYPEKAYFEYININETGSAEIPEEKRLYITTTHVFETDSKDLKIAKNKKAEIGFDLKIKQATLSVRAFEERLQNGYSMDYTFNTTKQLTYNEYKRTDEGLVLAESNPVLAQYYTPSNNLQSKTKGVDFDLNLGRFDAIRTAFSVNGMWIRTQSYSNKYTFYDGQSGGTGASRTHIGVYEPAMRKRNQQQFNTSVRITHNIPEIGFVITLTGQAIWQNWDWYHFGNNETPIKFISKLDGLVYDDFSMLTDIEYKQLIRNKGEEDKLLIKERKPQAITFNINVTKEIGQNMRASFFANNMFRNYPKVESSRNPGTYVTTLGEYQKLFFGLELSIKL